MRVIAMTDFDSGASLQELPVPEPASSELLVRVHAASVNGVDVGVASGDMRAMTEYEFPVVLGRDFAGVVERVGRDASRYRVGDEVIGFVGGPTLHDGTWAEYVLTPEDAYVAPKPANLDFVTAAALPLAGTAALLAVDAVDPAVDESVLVVGAGGGVGGFAVQLAAERGARVIATAKTGDEQRLRQLGAAETVDYTTDDVAATVRALHPEGVHALIDAVSWSASWPDVLAGLAEVVKEGGRVASTLGAARPEELAARGIAATNVMPYAQPAAVARVAQRAETGRLRVTIDAIRPLAEAAVALEQFAKGKRGKIIITVAEH
jgi:NADPH:quinone reductase-like Zn-dependent oxidoreductase